MKREKGQSAVEFALVLPILLLVVCGIIDFGWMFYNQLSVENACREGARYACVNSTAVNFQDEVSNKVIENIPDGLQSSASVTALFSDVAVPTAGDVTVSVKAKMKTITPILGIIYGDTKTIEYTIVMKVES